MIRPTAFEAYASDIDESMVALAAENAERAGVSDIVRTFAADARTIRTGGRRGTIVTNPPYGERLGTMEEVEELYRRLGKHFRSLAPWQAYIITSHEGFERLYGKRADNVKKLSIFLNVKLGGLSSVVCSVIYNNDIRLMRNG